MESCTPLVYVVVLNWNNWEDTLDCLSSLEKLDYPNYCAVVVDNGSSDGSEAKIREACPKVTILQTGQNLGFAGGNNVGIRYAIEQGAKFIWLLNNDAIADPKALHFLVLEALCDETVGLVGSKIYYHEHPDMIWFAGGNFSMSTAWSTHLGMGTRDVGQWDAARDVDYVSGCSMLLSESLLEDIGLMDTRFFLYYEETDLAIRASRNGWRVRYQPKSVVWHKISKTANLDSPHMVHYISKSHMIYAKKHISLIPILPALALLRYLLPFVVRGRLSTALSGVSGTISGLFGNVEKAD